MSETKTHTQQRQIDPTLMIEYHPINVFLHQGDYLRNYAKARKAERRGDPVEAMKWYRLSTECLRAAAMMNMVHLAIYDRGHSPYRGLETMTGKLSRKFGPLYAKQEKNVSFQKGCRRRHYWVVRTNE